MNLKEVKKNGNLSNLIIILSCVFVFIVTAIVSTVQLLSKGTYSMDSGQTSPPQPTGNVYHVGGNDYCKCSSPSDGYQTSCCGGDGGGNYWNVATPIDESSRTCQLGESYSRVIFHNVKLEEASIPVGEISMTGYTVTGIDSYLCVACGNKLTTECENAIKGIANAAWYVPAENTPFSLDPSPTYTTDQMLSQGFVDGMTWNTNSITRLNTTAVAKPTADAFCQNGIAYTGSEQTLTKPAETGYSFSGNKQTNAGEYTITAILNNGYKWTDDTTGDVTFKCSIAKATPIITLDSTSGTVLVGGTVKFNEKANTAGKFSNVSGDTSKATVNPATTNSIPANTDSEVTVTGVENGNATITVTFTPDDTNNYNTITSTSDGGRTYTATVGNAPVTDTTVDMPTPSSYCQVGLKYNGTEQTLTKTPATGYTFTNNKQTNAGTYDVLAKLDAGYKWSDGTTKDVTIVCSIGKADPEVYVNPTSITMPVGDSTIINGNNNIDGTYSSVSANTDIATTSSDGNKIKINGISRGTTIVRIKFTPKDEENFNAVIVPITVNVTSSSSGNIDVNPPTGTMGIMLVWMIGIAAIGYAYWYFKKINN